MKENFWLHNYSSKIKKKKKKKSSLDHGQEFQMEICLTNMER